MKDKYLREIAEKHYRNYLKQGCRSQGCIKVMLMSALKDLNHQWKARGLIDIMKKEF